MHLLRLTQPHPYLPTIQVWYETSFPADERRSFDELVQLLPCPDMHLCGLLADDQLVGFIIYWQLPDADVLFIEHFAIDPDQRGKGFGEQALRQMLQLKATYFLLEVEYPTDAIRQRRIRFYERAGFSLNPFDYAQPPYQRGHPAIPMHLMSLPTITRQDDFDGFSQLIRQRVYERFYN